MAERIQGSIVGVPQAVSGSASLWSGFRDKEGEANERPCG
jgi:hypothetical protein